MWVKLCKMWWGKPFHELLYSSIYTVIHAWKNMHIWRVICFLQFLTSHQEASYYVNILWEPVGWDGEFLKWHPLTIKRIYILYALGTVFFILSLKACNISLTVNLSFNIVVQIHNPLSYFWKSERYENPKFSIGLAPYLTWQPNLTRINGCCLRSLSH